MKNLKLKNLLSFLFLFVLLATTLVACKSTSVVPPTTTETTTSTTTKEVIRDTTFTIPKDSSYYKAYLECINGKVVLKKERKPIVKTGKHLEPPKVNLKDNVLTVDCETEAIRLLAQWKDTYTKEHQSEIKRIPYPVIQPLSWWQKTQIILGDLFLIILLVIALGFVLRITKVI